MDFFRYSIGTLAKAEFLATKMYCGYFKDGRFMRKGGLLGCDDGANEDWQIIEYSPGHGDIKLGERLVYWFVHLYGLRPVGPSSKD